MTRTCQNCGGDIEEVTARSGWQDDAYIRHYRCQGSCRQGGHTVHHTRTGRPIRRVGPIWFAGAAHTVHGPDADNQLVTDGGHRKAWQSTSVDVVESDRIVHNNGDETHGLVIDLGDAYVVQILDLDDGGFRDGDVIAATRTEAEAVTILEDWENEHINGLAPDSGWKNLFK